MLLLITVLMLHACTDGFEEINTNPNRLTTASPDELFGLTTVKVLNELSGENNWYVFGNYSQQLSMIGGSVPHMGVDGRYDRIWNNLYVNGLNPIFLFLRDPQYRDNPSYANRITIAKIWSSYIFYQLVSLYGPIPYEHACNGEPNIPFDKEEPVYRGILDTLKIAYTHLEAGNFKGDTYPANAEPFLKGDLKRWAQFAHCLRLRVAAQLTEVPEDWAPGLAGLAKEIVSEELDNSEKGLLITNNSGNFFMTFLSDRRENWNPIFREVRDNPLIRIDGPGNFPVMHESLSMYMNPMTYDDPCLATYFEEGSGGTTAAPLDAWLGRPSGHEAPEGYDWGIGVSNPYNNLMYFDYATIGREFGTMTANFYFYTYPELVFTKAEATLKGYWKAPKKAASAYYTDGIDARCARFGISGSPLNSYKRQPGIEWDTPTDTAFWGYTVYQDYLRLTDCLIGGPEDNFKRIVIQNWINFFTQGIDAYTYLRRTQQITFKPHFGASQNDAYINSTYAYTPQRLVYPRTEREINRKEAEKAIREYLLDNTLKDKEDRGTFRLIFAKEVPEILDAQEGRYSFPNDTKNHPAH